MEPMKQVDSVKKCRKFNLRMLRISLKYRPKLWEFILKMRHCIKKKNNLLKTMRIQLKSLKINIECKDSCMQTSDEVESPICSNCLKHLSEKPIQKNDFEENNVTHSEESKSGTDKGWNVGPDVDSSISIADQVKEVAQNALQQSGMVYVESAGMYYDYKTGYYYNSELGLYYHTDTGCYYVYSEAKNNFEFHSYPDRSLEASNPGLAAHERKKAKKHKKEKKTEDDLENLTKNLSQENEEDDSAQASKPKRRKLQKKKKAESKAEDKTQKVDTNDDTKVSEVDEKDSNGIEECIKENNVDSLAVSEEVNREELEDGECSGTDTEQSDGEKSDVEESRDSTSTASDIDDSVARHHPPCMRVIVKQTTLPKLKVGNLFLITKDGGSIGREGDHHSIVLRDQNVSRNHLNITYDLSRRRYLAMDLGSKNGTYLNGIRMSEAQTVSKSLEVVHGSVLDIGETKLLCHIHPGNDTCGHCEPGLIMETQEKEKVAYTRTCSVQMQHQLELARLKNKYAPQPPAIMECAYNDRAQARREAVGSSHHAEKTQSSDLDTFITPENKGFKLLQKMGWSKGEGLGKDNQGDTEPIPLVSNEGKAGLGTGAVGPPGPTPLVVNKLGPATMRLANKTKMLNLPAKAFQQEDEDDTE